MFNRVLLGLAGAVCLSACQPTVPDSGQGVGFGDNLEVQRQQRDAALAQGTIRATAPIGGAPIGGVTAPVNNGSAAATAAETTRVLAATNPNAAAANSGVAPVQASPSNPAPAVVDTAGISRENNFDAVSAQRGIEGDAARIAANRAQYEVIQPEALPDRGNTGPNIVAYALANKHPVGTKIYSRFGFNKEGRYQRACGRYGRAAEAQIAFLEQGGPERDRAGMDPDGDGYACEWDPAPFRQATNG